MRFGLGVISSEGQHIWTAFSMIFSGIPHSTIFGAPNMMTCDVWGSNWGQNGTRWNILGWVRTAGQHLIFLGQGSVENLKTFRDGAGRLGHSFYMGPGLGQDVQFFLKVSYLVLEMIINGMLCGAQNNQHDVRDTISSHLQLFAGFCDRRRTLVAANRAFQCSSAIWAITRAWRVGYRDRTGSEIILKVKNHISVPAFTITRNKWLEYSSNCYYIFFYYYF